MKLSSKQIQKYGMPVALLAVIVLLQLFNINVPLFSWLNIKNILMQNAAICLAALGLSFIMISGEGDMSFSGMFSMLAVVFAISVNNTGSFLIAFVLTVAIALAANLFISQMVTRFGFSSFIVSIAVMFMATGIEKALHQQTTLVQSEGVKAFASAEVGLPVIVWIFLVLFAAAYFVVGHTRFGFSLRVTGENKDAAIEAGMNVKRLKTLAYAIAAVLLALGAIIECNRVGAIYEQGKNYMLPIFAACYLGSSMFVPGRVNVAGTLVGALFVGLINGFMKMMNVESYIIPIVQGGILVLSVAISVFKNRDKIQQVKV